jgi:hypothetical protein
MAATALSEQQPATAIMAGKAEGISWAEFQKKYLAREDGYKYEWVKKEVVKSKHVDYTQFFIVNNLRNVFEQLRAAGQLSGILVAEGDIFLVKTTGGPTFPI